jgi:TRAP-type C4-dicarboxylate transport system permease small subunit
MREPSAHYTARLAGWLLAAAAAGLVLMVLIIGWQVIGRYVLGQSPSWAEQAALVLMIAFVFLGAAAGVREGFHIRITAMQAALSPRGWQRMQRVADFVVVLCGVAMAVWGTELVVRTWPHAIPTLGLPRGLAYLPLPVSGVLIALFGIERLFVARDDR